MLQAIRLDADLAQLAGRHCGCLFCQVALHLPKSSYTQMPRTLK